MSARLSAAAHSSRLALSEDFGGRGLQCVEANGTDLALTPEAVAALSDPGMASADSGGSACCIAQAPSVAAAGTLCCNLADAPAAKLPVNPNRNLVAR